MPLTSLEAQTEDVICARVYDKKNINAPYINKYIYIYIYIFWLKLARSKKDPIHPIHPKSPNSGKVLPILVKFDPKSRLSKLRVGCLLCPNQTPTQKQ